jgi:hypothetical protein
MGKQELKSVVRYKTFSDHSALPLLLCEDADAVALHLCCNIRQIISGQWAQHLFHEYTF